jgi:hypothetical protein
MLFIFNPYDGVKIIVQSFNLFHLYEKKGWLWHYHFYGLLNKGKNNLNHDLCSLHGCKNDNHWSSFLLDIIFLKKLFVI